MDAGNLQQGTFLNATPRMKTETRGKKQVQVPVQMSVPRSPVNRVSGEHPLLGTDDIAYVLGVGPWTPDKKADKEKAARHHAAFVSHRQSCCGNWRRWSEILHQLLRQCGRSGKGAPSLARGKARYARRSLCRRAASGAGSRATVLAQAYQTEFEGAWRASTASA